MNNIDNLFKDELGGYTEAPPPAVWDALEKRLQSDDKRHVYPYRWLWYFGIISFIVLLGSSIAWMMANNAANKGALAKATSTGTELSKNTAVAAVNGKPENTGDATESAKMSSHTTKAHHINQHTESQTKKVSSHKEANVIAKRTRKHSNSRTTVPTNKKATADDLYADTDDDQYIVGAPANTHKISGTPDNDGNGAAYATQARSQHNIHVAEMEPVQTVRENNYGSRTIVSASRANELADAHYDITLDDDNGPAEVTQHGHTASRASVRKSKNGSTGIAGSEHTYQASRKDAVAATKRKSSVHSKKINTTLLPGNTASSAVAVTTPKIEKSNSNVVASQPSTAAVRKNRRRAVINKTTPAAATTQPATDKALAALVPVHKTEATAEQGKKMPSDNAVAKKTSLVPGVTNAPVASVASGTTHKTRYRRVSKAEHSNNVQKEVALKSTPVVAIAPVTTPKAEIGAKTKNDNSATKPMPNQYGAGNKIAAKTVKKQVAKVETAKATAKQGDATMVDKKVVKNSKAVAPGKKVVPSGHPTGTKQTATEEEKIVGVAREKKGVEHKQPTAPAVPVKEAKKQDKVETATEKSLVKKDKAAETKPVGKAPEKKITEPAVDKSVAKNNGAPSKKETGRKANANKTTTPTPVVPPMNMYSSSLTKRGLEQETVVVDNLKVNNFEAQQPLADASNASDAYYELLPSTFKSDAGSDKAKNAGANAAKNASEDSSGTHRAFARKFEYGVKGGVETGFNGRAANKLVVSPYLQYNLSDKFSLLTQPSVKVSNVTKESVGDTRSYSDTTGGKYTATGNGAVYFITYVGGSAVSIQNTLTKYRYTYDSIVKSYSAGGTYVEVELPLMLQYKIGKRLSVYGGANSVFSKYSSIKENTKNYTGNYNTITLVPVNSPSTLPVTANLKLPGTPISQYAGPLYPAQKGDLFRMGYMLGFSYEYKRRWLFDALMQQAMVKPNYEAGVNTNAPLAMPYFRLTLGYKLSK